MQCLRIQAASTTTHRAIRQIRIIMAAAGVRLARAHYADLVAGSQPCEPDIRRTHQLRRDEKQALTVEAFGEELC